MSEELLRFLYESDRKNILLSLKALEYFEKSNEFVFPLDKEDLWFFKGNKPAMEKMRDEMNVLYRGGLLRREEVGYVVPFSGDILIYELNDKGEEIFKNIFHKQPQICTSRHYATPG